MLYEDATKAIKNLSKIYSTLNDGAFYDILYNGSTVLGVLKSEQYSFGMSVDKTYFDCLPHSHKLWMIVSELAMTPLSKRSTPNKWNVIVARDDSILAPFIVWKKKKYYPYGLELEAVSHPSELDEAIFDDYEYKDLIKYIKTLPDGEYQAKVAEHGKKLVNDSFLA